MRGGDVRAYGRGLQDLFAGKATDNAAAAAQDLSEVLILVYRYFTQDGK